MGLGRTWWMSLITIVLQAIVTMLGQASGVSTGNTMAALGALAVVGVSHNVARAIQDVARDKYVLNGRASLDQKVGGHA